MCRTIKSRLKNKEVRRSSFQPNEDRAPKWRHGSRNPPQQHAIASRQAAPVSQEPFTCLWRRAAWGYGRDRNFGGDEVDHIVGFGRILRLVWMEFRRLWSWGLRLLGPAANQSADYNVGLAELGAMSEANVLSNETPV
jgi:hypothetical protein